jgi:hypothetical protein
MEMNRMDELSAGTLVRWIDPAPDQKPLGIVVAPPGSEDTDTAYVLMADLDGNTDLEVFVGRPESTGRSVDELILESMEIVRDGDPELVALLSTFGPNWWHISAHLNGEHESQRDAACLICQTPDDPLQ